MSRTDVHRPAWVKERDPYLRREFIEIHDHRQGPCDIDRWHTEPYRLWADVRCYFRYNWSRNLYCGCHQCTGTRGRKYQNGQARAAWRNDRQRLLAGLEERPAKRFTSWF